MEANISVESLTNYTSPRNHWVFATGEQVNVDIYEESADDVRLRIWASFTDRTRNGERGGDYNPITRRLDVQLDQADLAKLLAVVAENHERLALAGPGALRARVTALETENADLRARLDRLRRVMDDIARLAGAVTEQDKSEQPPD